MKETQHITEEVSKQRVAAYCRVSTDEDNQQNSYRTQIAYYYKSVIASKNKEE